MSKASLLKSRGPSSRIASEKSPTQQDSVLGHLRRNRTASLVTGEDKVRESHAAVQSVNELSVSLRASLQQHNPDGMAELLEPSDPPQRREILRHLPHENRR